MLMLFNPQAMEFAGTAPLSFGADNSYRVIPRR
jgi:hypothetical protein